MHHLSKFVLHKNSKVQVANLTLEQNLIIDITWEITCISAAALCYRSYFPVLFLLLPLTFQSATSHYDFWLEGQSTEGKVVWTRHWILALRFAYIHLVITRILLDKWMENFCFSEKNALLLYALPLIMHENAAAFCQCFACCDNRTLNKTIKNDLEKDLFTIFCVVARLSGLRRNHYFTILHKVLLKSATQVITRHTSDQLMILIDWLVEAEGHSLGHIIVIIRSIYNVYTSLT